MTEGTVRVSYLELARPPAPIGTHPGTERIGRERLEQSEYLDLYRLVGGPLHWDQRLKMAHCELKRLLESERSRIYIVRDARGQALGLCEFEGLPPEIELKNFGLVPSVQGKGLGTWLLRTALHAQWNSNASRVWLHTDSWDHPAAIHLYQSAGFRICRVQDEPPANL